MKYKLFFLSLLTFNIQSQELVITEKSSENIMDIQIDTDKQKKLKEMLLDAILYANTLPKDEAKLILESVYIKSIRNRLNQITNKNKNNISKSINNE